ncbi:hypothetical protein [Bradyrhizobium sp.]|uniref:hypothetical protein n=1 Tax=Bradyrhizobium sp. TaxID=376 RepID=UPI002D585161|nr:hypothetical protein [Bradyrhizobium sp.]HZR74047.1 hypothetical protein [Bradyrhizobium sp.]
MTDKEPSALAKALARALAVNDDGDNWSWDRRYNPGVLMHMHALGVVAANYNSLEAELRFLLNSFMGKQMTSSNAGNYLFERLSNAERMDLLKRLYREQVGGTDLADRLDWFVKGFGICAENRNILMHSEPHGRTTNALQIISGLELRKASKSNPGVHNFISLKLEELRKVADDIDAFASFGFDLSIYQIARELGGVIRLATREIRPTLPDNPPEPVHLTLSPQRDAKDNPPRLGSSEG